MDDNWRNREINLHKDYVWLLRVTRGAVLLGIGILIGMAIYADLASRQAYAINVFTSVLGLGATALIFDELNRKRSRDDLKRQLVDDAASISNEIAKNGVHQIRRKKWLTGENGILKKADLHGANLSSVTLEIANLCEADLRGADLNNAHLNGANLCGGNLGLANMREAILDNANLSGAKLKCARLSEASMINANLTSSILESAVLDHVDLTGANLCGADLTNAVLYKAVLENVQFDESTTLPDGKKWRRTPETDKQRFTEESHPEVFHPDWTKIHNCEV